MHLAQEVSKVSPALRCSGSVGVIVVHSERRLSMHPCPSANELRGFSKMLTFANFSEYGD